MSLKNFYLNNFMRIFLLILIFIFSLQSWVLGEVKIDDIRFFLGYSGWSEGQLKVEIERNSWFINNTHSNKVLDMNVDTLWRDILKLSSSGINNKWKIGKERLSPCYTTRWSEILEVKV